MHLRTKVGLLAYIVACAALTSGSPPITAQGSAAPAPAKSTANSDALLYRQKLMRAMNAQSAVLGQIVSGAVPGENVALHLESMALLASAGLKAYEKQAPGGEAKPEIWKNWADFAERMQQFAQGTREAANLARRDGTDSALTNMMDAMSCRGCHRAYRDDKK